MTTSSDRLDRIEALVDKTSQAIEKLSEDIDRLSADQGRDRKWENRTWDVIKWVGASLPPW